RRGSPAGRVRRGSCSSSEEFSIVCRPGPDIGRVEYIGNDREEIGSGGDQLRRMGERDAADGAERHPQGCTKKRKARTHRRRPGGRGEHAAEGDVIRSLPYGFAREGCIVVAGRTENATFEPSA